MYRHIDVWMLHSLKSRISTKNTFINNNNNAYLLATYWLRHPAHYIDNFEVWQCSIDVWIAWLVEGLCSLADINLSVYRLIAAPGVIRFLTGNEHCRTRELYLFGSFHLKYVWFKRVWNAMNSKLNSHTSFTLFNLFRHNVDILMFLLSSVSYVIS